MGKATILTPLYISVAWTLMTSYQFFTQTTAETVTTYINTYLPIIGAWLVSRLDMIVFIHSFAWIFLLSSVIPSLLLGKERGVLAQFSVCLTLTFLAFVVQDVLIGVSSEALDQILGLAPLFQNPVLATSYLALPYLMMLGFDIRGKRKQKQIQKELEKEETETDDFPEDAYIETEEEEKTQEEEWIYPNQNARPQ